MLNAAVPAMSMTWKTSKVESNPSVVTILIEP
jgi:hypothetical protein